LQQINGSEVSRYPLCPNEGLCIVFNPFYLGPSPGWYGVTITNNIIANNVAGRDGAGVSLEDALKVTFVNNTVVSNDTTASAGVLYKTLGAVNSTAPPPGCDPTPPTGSGSATPCNLGGEAAHAPQPAGLVTMRNTPNLVRSLSPPVICPAGFGYSGGINLGAVGVLNGNCTTVSLPKLTNDMFWQNRAFRVDLVDVNGNVVTNPATPTGTGLLSQQNLVALTPLLNQTTWGGCASGANYWDVGVRGDTGPTNHGGVTGVTLSLDYSILTSLPSGGVLGSNNRAPTSSPVNAQYCNGARVPPEAPGLAPKGFQAPPGRSETTGLSPVFVFNNITPAATVDEGHNWINLTYGPLSLYSSAGQAMIADKSAAVSLGAYSIGATSAAINVGTNSGAPSVDFFGNSRPQGANVEIGAVEYVPPNFAVPVVNPAALAFGQVLVGATPTRDLTLSNNGGAAFTISSIAVPTGAFSRVGTGTFPTGAPNCPTAFPASLGVGASCTIRVQYTSPTPAATVSSGQVTIAGNVAVTNSPVALSGSSAAPTYIASIGPSPTDFGNWATGVTSSTRDLTVTNTGNSALGSATSPLTYTGTGLAAPFARVTGFTGDCGTTLAVGASCTIRLRFTPTAQQLYSGSITVNAGAAPLPTAAASATVTGTGVAPPAFPGLTVLDNFNRGNSSNSLGASWGSTLLSVNTNQAFCVTGLTGCALLGGSAVWNGAFGANQAAAFAIANATLNGDSLILKANNTSGLTGTYVRVRTTGASVVVETTTNSGLSFTTQWTVSPAAAYASGNILTALVDPAGVVYVWRTAGTTTTYVGGVGLPGDAAWTGGGQIGIRMTAGARVDDFAGGTVP
ncbi:MAG: choice-of-anchor D domain-containing protein, partial [Steroidobacteraceae bacterium]